MTARNELTRRKFLARVGVLGAVTGAGVTRGLGLPSSSAEAQVLPLPDLVDLLRPILAEISRDTLNGLATFVVPGPDRYSQAQGTPRSEPGAMEAESPDFLIQAFDNFLPFPQQLAGPVGQGLATAVSDLGIELPSSLTRLLPLPFRTLDAALARILEADGALPLSSVVALLLNLAATQVNPAAVSGPFVSPFARLSFDEKARTFELLEGPDADLLAALDTELAEPLRSSLSGLLRFLGGALIEFPAFAAYNEWAVFDPATKTLTGTPVGWTLTGYTGVADGRDDFIGYYQGRREVSDA